MYALYLTYACPAIDAMSDVLFVYEWCISADSRRIDGAAWCIRHEWNIAIYKRRRSAQTAADKYISQQELFTWRYTCNCRPGIQDNIHTCTRMYRLTIYTYDMSEISTVYAGWVGVSVTGAAARMTDVNTDDGCNMSTCSPRRPGRLTHNTQRWHY